MIDTLETDTLKIFINYEALPDAALWQNWRIDGDPELSLDLGKGHSKMKKTLVKDPHRYTRFYLCSHIRNWDGRLFYGVGSVDTRYSLDLQPTV